MLFGKRDIDLEVNLPSGRVLKAVYVSNRAKQISAVDASNEEEDIDSDDDEDYNDREFNATLTYYWDHARQQSKHVKIVAKRENSARGVSKLTVDFLNYPNLKLLKLEVDRTRLFNQTQLGVGISYEIDNGNKNRLDIDATLSSDADTIDIEIETNLQKPKFNTLYHNKFHR